MIYVTLGMNGNTPKMHLFTNLDRANEFISYNNGFLNTTCLTLNGKDVLNNRRAIR